MAHQNPDLSKARVGVIGGSGLYAIAGLEDERELEVETPYGLPSDRLRVGRLEGIETVFSGSPWTPSSIFAPRSALQGQSLGDAFAWCALVDFRFRRWLPPSFDTAKRHGGAQSIHRPNTTTASDVFREKDVWPM